MFFITSVLEEDPSGATICLNSQWNNIQTCYTSCFLYNNYHNIIKTGWALASVDRHRYNLLQSGQVSDPSTDWWSMTVQCCSSVLLQLHHLLHLLRHVCRWQNGEHHQQQPGVSRYRAATIWGYDCFVDVTSLFLPSLYPLISNVSFCLRQEMTSTLSL